MEGKGRQEINKIKPSQIPNKLYRQVRLVVCYQFHVEQL